MKHLLPLPLTLLLYAQTGLAQEQATSHTSETEPTVQVVERVMPAVVNINVEGVVRRYYRDWFFGTFPVQQNISSLGSGVLITPDGYIVTCAHVVDEASALKLKIRVTLNNGKIYDARLVDSSPDLDLALIKINAGEELPYLRLEPLSPNLLGQTAIALGNPVGFQNSVSKGILSARNRTIVTQDGTQVEGLLQTDASINPGNSGGPLVDIQGRFMGINSAKYAGERIEGLGFSIPGDRVLAYTREAIAVARGEKRGAPIPTPQQILSERFGLSVQEITPDLAQALGIPFTPDAGLLITDVDPESPAAERGIKAGMFLVRIGNTPTPEIAALPLQLLRIKKGDRINVAVSQITQRGPGMIFQQTYTLQLVAR
ncbi:MAG: trypsin-like peptidase domain-containing protein [Methylacidiphilales bacterium]|nr:trypsin-like peptidase domain-containing protein [Candidatus Methylacidiphilales bacterium]MDW8349254.1 trypsin-like peptidase domain-containing protein [Verrucomicrobiae bacterium]